MQTQIRVATLSDAAPVGRLFDAYRVFYGQSSDLPTSTRFIYDRLTAGDSVIWVAATRCDIVGFLQLFPTFSTLTTRRTFLLSDLFVDMQHRNQGIATNLILAAHEYAAKQGAESVTLFTAHENRAAQKLYESLGYQVEAGFKEYGFKIQA